MARRPEAEIQKSIVRCLRAALPLGAIFWATPNEAKMSKLAGFQRNEMGRVAGVPDLFVLHAGRLIGLEVKVPRDKIRGTAAGRQSDKQQAFQQALEGAGGAYHVVRSATEVLHVLQSEGVPVDGRNWLVAEAGKGRG